MSTDNSNRKLTSSVGKPKTPIKILGSRPTDPNQIKSRQDLVKFFNIPTKDWDALVVCDGSATTWERTAGWGAVIIQKTEVLPTVLSGSFSRGTNNVAELMGIFQALFYLAENDFGLQERGYGVHVISDSQYVVRGLNNLEKEGTIWAANSSSNRPIWMGILGCRRKGLVIRGHYIPRDTIRPNRLCHDLANFARIRAKHPQSDLAGAGWDLGQAMEND